MTYPVYIGYRAAGTMTVTAAVPLADCNYENALTGESVPVREGRLAAAGPVIIL